MEEIKQQLELVKYSLIGLIQDQSLLKDITNGIYPTSDKITSILKNTIIPNSRVEGSDWPSNAYSMIGLKRMNNLMDMLDYVRLNNIEGDLIETGVWKGGATIFMKIYCDLYNLNKKVFVCDSFEGLPKPSGKFSSDIGDIHHTYDALKVSLDEVKNNFKNYNCLDDNVVFIKGFFGQTLPNNNEIQKISLLRMDGDMYESTHDVFYSLYDKVVKSGVIIIDDFCLDGCRDCVNDFRKEKNIISEYTVIDRCGIYWFK
jgi:O-methyltransferase